MRAPPRSDRDRGDRDRGDRDRGPRRDDGPRVDLRDLIAYLAQGLVDDPATVDVTLVEEPDANVYEIEVDEEDLGKLIGKGGKTARAIRAIVGAVAPRRGKRTLVEILE